MESSDSSVEVDEVKRLRDQIKNLTFENNLLKQQTQSSKKLPQGVGLDSYDINLGRPSHIMSSSGDVLSDILDISNFDFADEETWLCTAKKRSTTPKANLTGVNLLKWLRIDVDDNHDYEFQIMRRSLVIKLEELQQSSRRNNIDTRTFTRPKKQMSRPGLRSMVDSPLQECREVLPSMPESLPFSENIDDISMPFNSTYTSMSIQESMNSNDNFETVEEHSLNTTFQQVENTRNIMFQKLEDTRLKVPTFRRSVDAKLNTIYHHDESSRLNSTFTKILSEPHLNTTTELRVLAPSLGRLSLSPQKVSSNPDTLNLTFNKSDRSSSLTKSHGLANTVTRRMAGSSLPEPDSPANGTFCADRPSSKRAASCDSIDDDCSSTSESSVNTNNRLMNAGDIQNIARLQEQSLHQAMSTPRSNDRKLSALHDEDLPSPIYSRVDMNHGYQSDHSDHSSVAKSSRSSQVSSPSSSLHGSTNMLAYDSGRRGPKLELPQMKPAVVGGKSRGASGLRPPSSRPTQGGAASGLPRPTTGIPRPQSRIPAPNTRKTVGNSVAVKKSNWTDGCF